MTAGLKITVCPQASGRAEPTSLVNMQTSRDFGTANLCEIGYNIALKCCVLSTKVEELPPLAPGGYSEAN